MLDKFKQIFSVVSAVIFSLAFTLTMNFSNIPGGTTAEQEVLISFSAERTETVAIVPETANEPLRLSGNRGRGRVIPGMVLQQALPAAPDYPILAVTRLKERDQENISFYTNLSTLAFPVRAGPSFC